MFVHRTPSRPRRIAAPAWLAIVLAAVLSLPAAAAGQLRTYKTRYYILHTDVSPRHTLEAIARLSAMAEEYHNRTKGFSGTIRRRLPVYLFASADGYRAAGGPPKTAGLYTGQRLMARASGPRTWHILQHEGFHQFAHRAIGGRLPIWINEGLAEYFGHGLWTGDEFVTGLIPPGRLRRIHAHILAGRLVPFPEMLTMSHAEWNARMSMRNYDQAWSMVHFLVHADDGKYRKAFSRHINDLSKGRPAHLSFARRFGRNIDAFQKRYTQWWSSRKRDATADLQAKAVVQGLTSYLARARLLDVDVPSAEAFFQAAREGKLSMNPDEHGDHWLPESLLKWLVKQAPLLGRWRLRDGTGFPKLQLTRKDGTVFTGSYRRPSRGEYDIDVDIDRPDASR
jgi:hypothetical protein